MAFSFVQEPIDVGVAFIKIDLLVAEQVSRLLLRIPYFHQPLHLSGGVISVRPVLVVVVNSIDEWPVADDELASRG